MTNETDMSNDTMTLRVSWPQNSLNRKRCWLYKAPNKTYPENAGAPTVSVTGRQVFDI